MAGEDIIIKGVTAITPLLIAVCTITSIPMAFGQGITGFTVSAIGPNPETNYKVCGGLMVGETGANLECQSLPGTTLQQYGWQFRILDIDIDYEKTKLYGCIIDDTTDVSFCDSIPMPAAGGSSHLSIDLNKPSKMPLPAHLDQEQSDTNLLEEEDSGGSEDSEDNDDNDEEEENE